MDKLEELSSYRRRGDLLTAGDPPLDNSFSFVVNVSNLVGAPYFELAEGCLLRRATEAERTIIKETLTRYYGATFYSLSWESTKTADEECRRLPEAEWRYFVISFEGSYRTITELEEVFAIAPLELQIELTFLNFATEDKAFSGFLSRPATLHETLGSSQYSLQFNEVSQADIKEITLIHKQLQAHDHQTLNLRRVIRLVMEMRDLPPYSQMQFLGYFAVLESLLTHLPKPSDPYESITRQVKQKIALLDQRWEPPLDYSQFKGAFARQGVEDNVLLPKCSRTWQRAGL